MGMPTIWGKSLCKYFHGLKAKSDLGTLWDTSAHYFSSSMLHAPLGFLMSGNIKGCEQAFIENGVWAGSPFRPLAKKAVTFAGEVEDLMQKTAGRNLEEALLENDFGI